MSTPRALGVGDDEVGGDQSKNRLSPKTSDAQKNLASETPTSIADLRFWPTCRKMILAEIRYETHDTELLALSRLLRLGSTTQKAASMKFSLFFMDTKSLSFC